jgi:hypothetical protein
MEYSMEIKVVCKEHAGVLQDFSFAFYIYGTQFIDWKQKIP